MVVFGVVVLVGVVVVLPASALGRLMGWLCGCGWVVMVVAAFVLYADCRLASYCRALYFLPYLCHLCVCPLIVVTGGDGVVFAGDVVAGSLCGGWCWVSWLSTRGLSECCLFSYSMVTC